MSKMKGIRAAGCGMGGKNNDSQASLKEFTKPGSKLKKAGKRLPPSRRGAID